MFVSHRIMYFYVFFIINWLPVIDTCTCTYTHLASTSSDQLTLIFLESLDIEVRVCTIRPTFCIKLLFKLINYIMSYFIRNYLIIIINRGMLLY